jgi:hypothetical protein
VCERERERVRERERERGMNEQKWMHKIKEKRKYK